MNAVDRMRNRRSGAGSSLSFLDVMSCGLGAAILIFLLIKHNTDAGSVEADRLLEQLETMERQTEQFRQEISDIARLNAEEEKLGSELLTQRERSLAALAALDVRMSAQREVNQQLQRTVQEREEQLAETDVIEILGGGQEDYVTGLQVKGRRIAIMLDHSASMTDEMLTDIFRYKVAPAQERQSAPKWVRAVKASKWLIARTPQNSTVAVVGFAESAKVLGPGTWFATASDAQLASVQRDLEALVPNGATNLEEGLAALAALSPPPTDVYLITDGLPTRATSGGRCARGPRVTADCRDTLFRNAARGARDKLGSFTMNVVLLPLEGDWNAGPAYMAWSVGNGGTLISPPASWP